LRPRARFDPADRDCPLCHGFVPGGALLQVLARHFQVCPVLDSSA
jgi:hypothetical protein